MTLVLKMRGELEPHHIAGNFEGFMSELQVAAAKGLPYLILNEEDGKPIAVNQANLLWVKPLGEEEELATYIG